MKNPLNVQGQMFLALWLKSRPYYKGLGVVNYRGWNHLGFKWRMPDDDSYMRDDVGKFEYQSGRTGFEDLPDGKLFRLEDLVTKDEIEPVKAEFYEFC